MEDGHEEDGALVLEVEFEAEEEEGEEVVGVDGEEFEDGFFAFGGLEAEDEEVEEDLKFVLELFVVEFVGLGLDFFDDIFDGAV